MISFDFLGKDAYQAGIKEHQVTIIEQSWNERDIPFAASQEKIVDPFRQCGDNLEIIFFCVKHAAIRKQGEYFRLFHIFVFVYEVFEYGKCSSWLNPTMDKSKLHKINEKLKVKSEKRWNVFLYS